MSFIARAATFAATVFCAGFLAGTTTPGFAQELKHAPISTFNALTIPQVPMTAPAAESPAAPSIEIAPSTEMPKLRPAIVETADDDTVTAPDDASDYGSLAAAVAAQDHAAEDRELRCLAAGVFFESNGEPLAGQFAVAQTILNRTKSGRFPTSVCSVLTQRGQFSFVRGGVVPVPEGRGGWKTAVAVAKVAMRDLWDGAADEALYFHARRVSPGWRMTKIAAIGNHVFYR